MKICHNWTFLVSRHWKTSHVTFSKLCRILFHRIFLTEQKLSEAEIGFDGSHHERSFWFFITGIDVCSEVNESLAGHHVARHGSTPQQGSPTRYRISRIYFSTCSSSESYYYQFVCLVNASQEARLLAWLLVFEASSGRSEITVATKSPIVPVWVVLGFFKKFRKISCHFQKIFLWTPSSPSPSLGRISVQLFRRPRRNTQTKIFLKNPKTTFGQRFFSRNIWKFRKLHTAFRNVVVFLLVT